MSFTKLLPAGLCLTLFLALAGDARSQVPGVPGRVYGPFDAGPPVSIGRRVNIFIPPIGRFGGFSANIGRGNVDINVGPSGYGPYGGPAFGGVNVNVHRPDVIYGPAIYGYGDGLGQPAPFPGPHPYLGCVDGNCDPDPTLAPAPTPVPEANEDSVLPPTPGSGLTAPRTGEGDKLGEETVVPRRTQSGPKLEGPQLPPQSSIDPATRFFPVSGPRFLPPGAIRANGFDVDNSVRPNAPVLPGNDPFGPTRPRPMPGDPSIPAT